MPARSAARSPSPTSKPSFIDRLKKPFGPKARLFSEFYVQPDDPHRVYGPGDLITGSVILKVYKTPNSPGESYRHYNAALTSGRTRKAGGYYGNGFVSLFEDEITLCGDGRLGEGTYQFNFELIFPRDHLPSSIDFERGTVSYMITSTLTRPTTLSPTSHCDREIRFQEDIDVAPLSQPKPRIITLEPITRRSKPRPKAKRVCTSACTDHSTSRSTFGSEDTATGADIIDRPLETRSQIGLDRPRSPVQSELSYDSHMSSGGGTSSAIDSAAPSARTCDSRHTGSKSASSCERCQKRPITASISIEKAGFLRGDVVPIKVWLTHTRAVKSLRGVIVTLYRQARVDLHPALPLIRGGDDEGYPRLKSGLSNLSISSASSTHVYRKDLDQQFASLIVNPATMQAELKVILRIPEEAFPSIASVPGGMISFKYYVEVVVDIQGKLAGLDKYLPTANTPQGGMLANRPVEGNSGSNYAPLGGHFINTEDIKREPSVIYSVFEVVVGTRDSERRSPWKQPETGVSTMIGPEAAQNNRGEIGTSVHTTNDAHRTDSNVHEPLSWDQYWQHHPPDQDGPDHPSSPPPEHFTPPLSIDDDCDLDEKERLRRAEARLLPSAPPDAGESSNGTHAQVPSAAQLDDTQLHPETATAPPHFDFGFDGRSAPHSVHTVVHFDEAEASAPAYSPERRNISVASDEKEDVRRQRLEGERSAPPPADAGAQASTRAFSTPNGTNSASSAPAAPSASLPTPSAPPESSVDSYDHHDFSSSSLHHPLPRYER